MAFFDFASNISETKELHFNVSLRTRYYKNKYLDMKNYILNYVKENKLFLKSEDDNHGELFIQSSTYHIIVSIVQITPFETAVDFKVQTYRIFGLYKPRKIIMSLYKYLDTKANFKGTGLHP